MRGRTEDGVYYRGVEEFHPGDPDYDVMLPIARENPIEPDYPPQRPVDPDTMATILHDAGLDTPTENK
ncbi:hypothetical protein [Nocardia sp. NPDC051463]|uniref:hypothetical protein n=1 Tax=Nocardia sp. NPDC051463 TaxID=3154845 RepID=UPI00344C8596